MNELRGIASIQNMQFFSFAGLISYDKIFFIRILKKILEYLLSWNINDSFFFNCSDIQEEYGNYSQQNKVIIIILLAT